MKESIRELLIMYFIMCVVYIYLQLEMADCRYSGDERLLNCAVVVLKRLTAEWYLALYAVFGLLAMLSTCHIPISLIVGPAHHRQ